jgi:putative ABC transport system permease protein
MISPRWRKILRDMWRNRRRTILVVLSIAVGVFAVGTVAIMRDIVTGDMVASYQAANPPSAVIYVNGSFDDKMVESVKRIDGVAEAEGREYVVVTFQHPQSETWYPLQLYAVPDYENIRIGKLQREESFGPAPELWPKPSVYPPPAKQILIERTSWLPGIALGLAPGARQGDTITIDTLIGGKRKVPMAGMVYDAVHGSAPWTGGAYGYVTFDTMDWLGFPRSYNQLLLRVTGNRTDVKHIREVGAAVESRLEAGGLDVARVDVPAPGKLPQDGVYQGLLALLTALGVSSLLLSVFLLINTVSALLAQQVRQIGVMKAIGARTPQITRLYLGMVIVFGLVALLIAAPLSVYVGRRIIGLMSYLLDFTLGEFRLSPSVLLIQASMAILVPLFAALVPILRGSRVTVREAITSYGVSSSQFGRSRIDRFLRSLTGLPAPIAMSFRNTFRNKGRLILTLITLALAGTIMMAVFNVRQSLTGTVDEMFRYWAFDIIAAFRQPYRLGRLQPIAQSVPGVKVVEGWGGAVGYRVRPDGSLSDAISLQSPPAGSVMVNPILEEGRWLMPDDQNALAVTANLMSAEPDLKVGDELVLKINDEETRWQIVGVVRFAQPVPFAYANNEYLSQLLGMAGRVSTLTIITDRHDAASRTQVADALQHQFTEAGLDVIIVQTISQARASSEMLFTILISVLLSMGVLLAVVGGIGLAGTMSLNVLERIREVGVLRAIGARNRAVLQVVIIEGVLVGLLSYVVGALLSYPLGMPIAQAVGMFSISMAVTYQVSIAGMLIWLVLVIVISAVASYFPARQAANLSVRQVLAYEQ